jgi:ATP synthase protein I
MSKSAPDPDKLRALGERLDEVRRRDAAAKVQPPPTPFGIAFRFSTELVVALFVGAAMGWGLDWLFGTRPVFIVIMSLFGAAAGMRNVIRAAKEMNVRNAASIAAAPAPEDEEDD